MGHPTCAKEAKFSVGEGSGHQGGKLQVRLYLTGWGMWLQGWLGHQPAAPNISETDVTADLRFTHLSALARTSNAV